MNNIKFFNSVCYNNQPKTIGQSLLETADDYFFLGGKKAYVIPDQTKAGVEGVVLSKANSPFLLTALKVISFATVIIPIIFLAIKTTLRCKNHFHLIDPKAELESGVDISENLIKKIQQLMPNIFKDTKDDQIQQIKLGKIFRISEFPDYIFKMDSKSATEIRFANMVTTKEICMADQLDLLTIPQARMFEVPIENGNNCYLIAERWYDIKTTDSAQAENYRAHADSLNESVRQLAIFIAKAGFYDVIWRNIPVLDDAPEFTGPRRIGLIDLEHMAPIMSKDGFIGSYNGSVGLVGCVFSESQIDTALKIAKQYNIKIFNSSNIKKNRLKEIKEDQQLFEFYQKNGILEDRLKPISVDLETLGLDLDEKGVFKKERLTLDEASEVTDLVWEETNITLREFALEMIGHINDLIKNSNPAESVKGARKIRLKTRTPPMNTYANVYEGPFKDGCFSDEKFQNLWIYRMIHALVEKRYLFKLIKTYGNGYSIQA